MFREESVVRLGNQKISLKTDETECEQGAVETAEHHHTGEVTADSCRSYLGLSSSPFGLILNFNTRFKLMKTKQLYPLKPMNIFYVGLKNVYLV